MFYGLPFEGVDELPDGRVLSLPRHGGAGEELRSEVLAGDGIVVPAHLDRPLVSSVLALCGTASFKFVVLTQRFPVSAGLLGAALAFPVSAGHAPLGFSR